MRRKGFFGETAFELGLKRTVNWEILDKRTLLTKDTSDQEQVRIATKVSVHSFGWVTGNTNLKNSIKENPSMKLYIKEKPCTSNTIPLILYRKTLHKFRILLLLKSVFLRVNIFRTLESQLFYLQDKKF